MKIKTVFVGFVTTLLASTCLRAQSLPQKGYVEIGEMMVRVFGAQLQTNRFLLICDGVNMKPVTVELGRECQLVLTSNGPGGKVRFDRPEVDDPSVRLFKGTIPGGVHVQVQDFSGQKDIDIIADTITLKYLPKSPAK